MSRVVISGIGFVTPCGIGSTGSDLYKNCCQPSVYDLADNKKLYHCDLPDLSAHADYPDKKTFRYMRPEAIYALIAASLAIRDAGLEHFDHTTTSMYTASGQCYSDMWPFIRSGIIAASDNDIFDIKKFGVTGLSKINPFFSIRTLGALPIALISQKYAIRGENATFSSFGAESSEMFIYAMDDILNRKADVVIIGSFQFMRNLIEIENLYSNQFYHGDFHGSSSSSFIILESEKHNNRRNGKCYGYLDDVLFKYAPILGNNEIKYPVKLFYGMYAEKYSTFPDYVIVNSSGTLANHHNEMAAITTTMPVSTVMSYFDILGALLANAEPFGVINLICKTNQQCSGVSFSRSLSGMESAILVSKGDTTI